jgi:hypothetical protein
MSYETATHHLDPRITFCFLVFHLGHRALSRMRKAKSNTREIQEQVGANGTGTLRNAESKIKHVNQTSASPIIFGYSLPHLNFTSVPESLRAICSFAPASGVSESTGNHLFT